MKLTTGLYFLFVILIASCAVTSNLGGGPPDKNPPVIIEERSSQNYSTRWSDRKITLEFDEFIVLRDPAKQIVISPPLVYLPQYKVRGKTIYVEFNEREELKSDATYIINFGESIQDFTENNKLENFRFVFSTGDKIDSLEVSGQVIDAYTGQGLEGITVMLYKNLQDSALLKEKPFYFTKTNKSGEYKIQNIRKDTFKLIAIKDLNLSLTWDETVEPIGFIDTLIYFPDSILALKNKIEVSQSYPKYKVSDLKEPYYGHFTMLLNTVPYSEISIETTPAIQYFKAFKNDTIKLWFIEMPDSVVVNLGFDSLALKTRLTSDKKPTKLNLSYIEDKKILTLARGIKIISSHPIASWNTDSIVVSSDTSEIELNWKVNKIDDIRYELIPAEWLAEKRLTINIGENTFKDIYNNGNESLKAVWDLYSDERLGNIKLNISGLDSTLQYLLELLEKDKIIEKKTINGRTAVVSTIERLIPGEYKLRIIEDSNGNGRWDAANYWDGLQAERIKVFELEKLKENWTLESIILWTNTPKDDE